MDGPVRLRMNSQSGLALVELMVTLAVAAVLFYAAVPQVQTFLASNRASSQVNLFRSGIALAREWAVVNATTVAVCAKASKTANELLCGDNGDWPNGWIIFRDEDGNPGELDGSDMPLRVYISLNGSPQITTSKAFFRFRADGLSTDASISRIQLSQQDARADSTRCLHVSPSGMLRVERAACP